VLLAEITGKSRPWVLAHPEAELTHEQTTLFVQQLARIRSGVPLAYVLERQAFFGRDFQVSSATLIPRPETEQIIAIALEIAADFPAGFLAADVGTGSGCIGITLACELPGTILAIDRSLEALRIALRNARVHQVDGRCRMVQAALLDPFNVQCMLICANLPYIPTSRLKTLQVARHEPNQALDGGPDGMRYTRPLIDHMELYLHPAGSAILELDHTHASALHERASQTLPGRPVRLQDDISGMARFLIIGPEGG
jgi:release factor glutamine methyltransferase